MDETIYQKDLEFSLFLTPDRVIRLRRHNKSVPCPHSHPDSFCNSLCPHFEMHIGDQYLQINLSCGNGVTREISIKKKED